MSTLAEVLSKHAGVVLADGIMWCTCGADLWSHRTGFTAGALPIYGSVGETAHTHHLAAVVAEWLESEQSVEVVAEAIFDSTDPHQRKRYEEGNAVSGYDDEYARSALAALAAHAKGETDE